MGRNMRLRWPDTILKDSEPGAWIEEHLFPQDSLDPAAFEWTETLYRCEIPTHPLEFVVFGRPRPASFSPSDLNAALISACGALSYEQSAYWWNVHVHNNCARVVERVGTYSFEDPMEPLFIHLCRNPADEGGMSYAGLLDRRYRWALSLESGDQFVISVHGPRAFCQQVAATIGVAA